MGFSVKLRVLRVQTTKNGRSRKKLQITSILYLKKKNFANTFIICYNFLRFPSKLVILGRVCSILHADNRFFARNYEENRV